MAVADLCASPGSKTQQLIEAINPPLPLAPPDDGAGAADAVDAGEPGKVAGAEAAGASFGYAPARGPSGLVIANDMDYRR